MRIALLSGGRFAALMLALLTQACGGSEDSLVEVVAIGPPDAPFAAGGRLPPAAQLLRGATAEGLVSLDEQGQVIPALADRWIVTDDGLSYIFRLRDGNWPDGSPLTADSARTALRQSIAALQGTAMALDLAGMDDLRTMAGRVIEVRLVHPKPQLLSLLAQPELGLLRKGRGAGPMSMTRDGGIVGLLPLAPEKRGMPALDDWNDRVRKLRFRALPAGQAIERFNQGEANAVLGGKIEHFPMVDALGLSRGTVKLDPVAGLFGLAVVHDDGFLSKPSNREAIAMAIDREGLIAAFRVGGWSASNRIVPATTQEAPPEPGERWTDLDLAERRAAALARVQRWRGGRAEAIRLRIAMPKGPGADRIFARLADDFKLAGLEAVRVGEGDSADLRLVDAVARYPQAEWFLNQLNCAGQRGLCHSEADRDLAAAGRTADPAARSALLAQATAKLTDANVFIPFGPPMRWSLVRGDMTGFVANRLGYHPLMPLALRPK